MELFWPWWANFDRLMLMFLLLIGAGVLLFLLLRQALCWYWRINEGVDELRAIRELLREINTKLDREADVSPDQPGQGADKCPCCGSELSDQPGKQEP